MRHGDQMIDVAMKIATVAFWNRVDETGVPLIVHAVSVMHRVHRMQPDDQELMAAGLLHDLFEDTHWIEMDLRERGISERVIAAIKIVTRDKAKESYVEFRGRILASCNRDAILVKLADSRDNLWRCMRSPRHVTLANRYNMNIGMLMEWLERNPA